MKSDNDLISASLVKRFKEWWVAASGGSDYKVPPAAAPLPEKVFLSPAGRLHSGRANKRKALLWAG